jgi:outer membrane protein assembly factor BamB
MSRGDLGRTGSYIADEKTPVGQLDWKFKAEYGCYSSPVISQGIVYFNSSAGYVYAVNASNGKTHWVFKREAYVGDSPAILDDMLYVSGLDSFLYAINAKTGVEAWRFKAGDMIMSSPAIYAGKAYFGSYDGHLYAVDIRTGKEIWKFKTQGNGQPINSFPEPGHRDPYDYDNLGAIVSDPAISNETVYFSSYDGYLYAIDANTGSEKWKFITNGYPTDPAISNETIYFGSHGSFYALDDKGQVKWKFSTENPKEYYSSAAVTNSIVYFTHSVNHNKSELEQHDQYSYSIYAVTEKTGEVIWESEILSHPHGLTISNKVLYFYGGDSIFAFNADTGKELWKFKTESSRYSEVAISEGKIYFCTEDYLYALK